MRRRRIVVRGPVPLASPRLFGSARLSAAQATAVTRPVTFPSNPANPTNPLNCKVLLALGADLTQPWYTWSWTDVSQWVRFQAGISTSQGRPDWTSTVRASSGQLTFDNRDGRFSRRNPNGPYYGLLTFNTPIWGTVDPGSGVVSRLQQYVNEWPTRWDRSGNDSTVPIETAGVLRRLGINGETKSPMRRTILASRPVAYWPLEEGTTSTQALSGLVGGVAMTGNAASFGSTTGPVGAITAPDMTASRLVGLVTGCSTTRWSVGFGHEFSQYNGVAALTAYTNSATFAQFQIIPPLFAGLSWRVTIVNSTGSVVTELDDASIDTSITSTALLSTWHHFAVSCEQSGANVISRFYVDGVLQATDTTAGTLDAVNRIITAPSNLNIADDFASVSHIEVSNNATAAGGLALNGYVGETATARIVRACAEEGVALVCNAATAASPQMGPQPVGAFLDVVRDAESVDQGVLYEVDWGLGYLTLGERTNAPITFVMDFDQRHVAVEPQPADDDQRLKNRWTASRSTGAQVTTERSSGPMGTQAGGPGVYPDSVTSNVRYDSQLGDQAGWRTNLGTVDEDRWPDVDIRLHATPDLIPSWVTMPFGGRLTMANPPVQVAPDVIHAVREGWSERWDPFTWVAALNTSPYAPYRVGTLAADTGDTAETTLILTPDTLTLAAGVGTADVTWSINASPIWTVDPESFPRYIWWEGEVVQLTNCTGGSAPQTWTVVRSINGVVKAHLANSSGRIYRPGVLALA